MSLNRTSKLPALQGCHPGLQAGPALLLPGCPAGGLTWRCRPALRQALRQPVRQVLHRIRAGQPGHLRQLLHAEHTITASRGRPLQEDDRDWPGLCLFWSALNGLH